MSRILYLSPFYITFILVAYAYLNGLGCDFKITRMVADASNETMSEEFGVCRDGRINFVITEGSTKSQWGLSGRYLSIGKQIYILFEPRKHINKSINSNVSQLDKEMNVSSGMYFYNYAILPLSHKKLALFGKVPVNDVFLYDFDGKVDFWDSFIGYEHILKKHNGETGL